MELSLVGAVELFLVFIFGFLLGWLGDDAFRWASEQING